MISAIMATPISAGVSAPVSYTHLGSVEFSLESAVINQYGNQIRKVVLQTLENLDVKDVKISVVDKGALDCTIKARVEGAVFRSVDQIEDIPWGGAIR